VVTLHCDLTITTTTTHTHTHTMHCNLHFLRGAQAPPAAFAIPPSANTSVLLHLPGGAKDRPHPTLIPNTSRCAA
jgi:hypothetical protein